MGSRQTPYDKPLHTTKTHYNKIPFTTKPLRQNSPGQTHYGKPPIRLNPLTPRFYKNLFLCYVGCNPKTSLTRLNNFLRGCRGPTSGGIHFASESGFVVDSFVVLGFVVGVYTVPVICWPWPWFSRHPLWRIAPHSDAIILCRGPLPPSNVNPIFRLFFLTTPFQFVLGLPDPFVRGVTKVGGGEGTARVTPSRGDTRLKSKFWLNLERTLDKRRRTVGIVRRRGRWLKRLSVS